MPPTPGNSPEAHVPAAEQLCGPRVGGIEVDGGAESFTVLRIQRHTKTQHRIRDKNRGSPYRPGFPVWR